MANENKYVNEDQSQVPAGTVVRVLDKMQPPTDKDFDRERDRQRRITTVEQRNQDGEVVSLIPGKAFDEVFNPANATQATKRLIQSQNEAGKKLNRIGWNKVMVINLMPFALKPNGVLTERYGLSVPPAPIEPKSKEFPSYSFRLLDRLYWDNKDRGAGMDDVDNFEAIPWTPLEVADDFIKEYNEVQRCGGVFVYEGEQMPETSPGLKNMLFKAAEARNQWCMARVEEANLEFASEASRKNITEVHRNAWRILFHAGLVKKEDQPPWLTAINPSAVKAHAEICKRCGTGLAGGYACKECGNIINALAAYEDGAIEWGHVSFQKMTDEEFKKATEIKNRRAKQLAAMEKAAAK